jgi:hypothetical protein
MNLTKEQIHQQQAAVYGLPPQTIDVSHMSHEQIEALRAVLFQHDAQNAAMAREFDLNKPPTPPYRYQEFPRMLYRDGRTFIVKDQRELEEQCGLGWSKTPPATMEVNLGGELPAAIMVEVAAIDAEARKPSHQDLIEEVEKLRAENAALTKAAETSHDDPTEEEKRRKRSADAANAARARWEKRKPAPASSTPAVEGTTLM